MNVFEEAARARDFWLVAVMERHVERREWCGGGGDGGVWLQVE